VALILGLAFAHLAELPGKLRLDGPTWLTVQQNLYIGFGRLAAVAEPLGILMAWILVFMLRGYRSSFRLALLAAACTTVGLVEWALVVSPMNTLLNGWSVASLPPNWTACREQWELGHALHAILFGVAFCALLGMNGRDTPAHSAMPTDSTTATAPARSPLTGLRRSGRRGLRP
jgi:hypothetical protein